MVSATEAVRGQLVWRASTHSGSGDCLEVAITGDDHRDVILVRDSKDMRGPRLSFSRRNWLAFVAFVRISQDRS